MTKLMFAAAAAAFLATSAIAQDSRPAPRDGMSPPAYTQGSGQRAGGPASELNSPTGLPPGATTGTINAPRPNGPNARQSPTLTPGGAAQIPSYQQGSGQSSGGPAKELNRQ